MEESTIRHVAAVGKAEAVGPTTLWLNVTVEGVPVDAMVDSGSESTIISRCMLHKVFCHCRQLGPPEPKLTVPSITFYGKGGKVSGKELLITAQTALILSSDRRSAQVPVFVQPFSEQDCLLGMNAAQVWDYSFWIREIALFSHNHMILTVRVLQFTWCRSVPSLDAKECLSKPRQTFLNREKYSLNPISTHWACMVLVLNKPCFRCLPKESCTFLYRISQSATRLPEGMELGRIEVVPELTSPPPPVVADRESVVCVSVTTIDPEERRWQLRSMLKISKDTVNPREFQDFETFLLENTDVFALSDDELGCTNIVQHSIDTGDIPPIHQPPYRTPFSQ